MTEQGQDTELLKRIGELPREIRPARDPWPEIAARIQSPAQRPARTRGPRWAMLGAAASLVLALAAGWMLAPRWAGETVPESAAPRVAATEVTAPSLAGLPAAVAASEAEYQAAFREFIPVGAARSSLSPQTVAHIETGWADLRAAEQRLALALKANPNDPFLNDRMLELRARQLAFLQRLATLDMDNRRLTI